MNDKHNILRRSLILGLSAALPGLAAAHAAKGHAAAPPKFEQKDWGIAGQPKAAARRIDVGMGDDMRFKPALIEVKQGETIRFVVRNQGKLLHEFVIGTKPELDAHAALMLKFPNMEHDEPYMAHVAPGKSGEILWNFNRAGEFEFACLIAGHYQAGMTGKIMVLAKKGA